MRLVAGAEVVAAASLGRPSGLALQGATARQLAAGFRVAAPQQQHTPASSSSSTAARSPGFCRTWARSVISPRPERTAGEVAKIRQTLVSLAPTCEPLCFRRATTLRASPSEPRGLNLDSPAHQPPLAFASRWNANGGSQKSPNPHSPARLLPWVNLHTACATVLQDAAFGFR